MSFFWVGHFGFFFQKNIFFWFLSMKTSSPFILGIIYFCTMDGFFRILKKTSSELICTQSYCLESFNWNSNLEWALMSKVDQSCFIERFISNKTPPGSIRFATLQILRNGKKTLFNRRPVGSTDQAYSSCFYFRISWILMEWPWFCFFDSHGFLQGLRNLKHWLLQN